MNRILFYFIVSSLFAATVLAIELPLWPEKFSQSMTVDFGDLITTGKFWYDSTLKAQRFDFQNGNTKKGCGAIHPGNTPCSYLINNGWLYAIYPEREICCKLVQESIIARDWLKDYSYYGEGSIDGETFNVWYQNFGEGFDSFYYVDKSQKQIPRRQYEGKRIYLDYWTNSYNEGPINPSIFDVPSYCTKLCGYNGQDFAKSTKLINNFFEMTNKSKSNKS